MMSGDVRLEWTSPFLGLHDLLQTAHQLERLLWLKAFIDLIRWSSLAKGKIYIDHPRESQRTSQKKQQRRLQC
jgi:hypothetical protein